MKVLLLVVLLGLVQGKVYNSDYRFGQSKSLPGVPMCSTFDDLKEEQGSWEWKVAIAKVLVKVQTNAALAFAGSSDDALVDFVKKATAPSPLEADASAVKRFSEYLKRKTASWGRAFLQAARSVPTPRHSALAFPALPGLQKYVDLFRTIPKPDNLKHMFDDDLFVEYRLAGPNPTQIKGISRLPRGWTLSDAQFNRAMESTGDSVRRALEEERVFLCDYAALKDIRIKHNIERKGGGLFAPRALFAVSLKTGRLLPVAIQPHVEHPHLEVRHTPGRVWNWRIAKQTVQAADFAWHELVSHLAETHLVIEAVAVATHRRIAEDHPAFRLLTPHFKGYFFHISIIIISSSLLLEP
jgi:arachidonate 15-lipoxygenase